MDNNNISSNINLLKIIINKITDSVNGVFEEKQNYINTDNFNKNCTNDLDCMDLSLFCNLTAKRCQCTKFYFRNESNSVCEFLPANLADWMKNKTLPTEDTFYTYNTASHMSLKWTIWISIATIILGIIFLILCGIYACLGDKHQGNSKTAKILYKKQKESKKIKETPVENFK